MLLLKLVREVKTRLGNDLPAYLERQLESKLRGPYVTTLLVTFPDGDKPTAEDEMSKTGPLNSMRAVFGSVEAVQDGIGLTRSV